MIDLYCHMLPSIDDGPRTMSESLELARSLSQAGYQTIAATPHMIPGTAWMPTVETVRTKVADVNKAVRNLGLDLTILYGMEIAIDPQIPDLLDQGAVLPLGDSACLLIEPPFHQLPPGWEQVIFDLLAKGHPVLLAHPERCAQLAADPALIEKVIASGAYLQINWGSFLGQFGKEAARSARLLAKHGWVHCIATDSHHLKGPIPRKLQTAMSSLTKLIGQENLRQLTLDNPRRLLQGKPLSEIQVSPVNEDKKKPWWRFWGHKISD